MHRSICRHSLFSAIAIFYHFAETQGKRAILFLTLSYYHCMIGNEVFLLITYLYL